MSLPHAFQFFLHNCPSQNFPLIFMNESSGIMPTTPSVSSLPSTTSSPSSFALLIHPRQSTPCTTQVQVPIWLPPAYDTCTMQATLIPCAGTIPTSSCPPSKQVTGTPHASASTPFPTPLPPAGISSSGHGTTLTAGAAIGITIGVIALLGILLCLCRSAYGTASLPVRSQPRSSNGRGGKYWDRDSGGGKYPPYPVEPRGGGRRRAPALPDYSKYNWYRPQEVPYRERWVGGDGYVRPLSPWRAVMYGYPAASYGTRAAPKRTRYVVRRGSTYPDGGGYRDPDLRAQRRGDYDPVRMRDRSPGRDPLAGADSGALVVRGGRERVPVRYLPPTVVTASESGTGRSGGRWSGVGGGFWR